MSALQRPLFHATVTTVVNVGREECDVYCGRPSGGRRVEDCQPGESGYFGNPWNVREFPDAMERYRHYFAGRIANDPVFRAEVLKLKGKRLGCFCVSPRTGAGECHAKVIAEHLEST